MMLLSWRLPVEYLRLYHGERLIKWFLFGGIIALAGMAAVLFVVVFPRRRRAEVEYEEDGE